MHIRSWFLISWWIIRFTQWLSFSSRKIGNQERYDVWLFLEIMKTHNNPDGGNKKLVSKKTVIPSSSETSTEVEKNTQSDRVWSVEMVKDFIEFSTQKREESETSASRNKKALFKWMKNSIHKKTMQKLKNRVDVRFVNKSKDYLKLVSRPVLCPKNYLITTW